MWQLKHVSLKGEYECYASVPGGCALEACTSRKWEVWNDNDWIVDSKVKMVTGAEAERAVSGPCVCAARKS
jgi:hypothetical protein